MAKEVDEPVTKVNGSRGMTARCVAHLGYCLDDGDQWPASMEGIGTPPLVYP